MLFKNINELKQFLPVTKSAAWEDIKPFVDTAEQDYIIPFLTQVEYDKIDAAFNNTTPLSSDMKKLLKSARRPLANAAYMEYLAFGNVNIGKDGITASGNKEAVVASEWRIDGLKLSLENGYFGGIEKMMIECENNSITSASWPTSNAGSEFREGYLNTISEFNREFYLGSRRTFSMLKSIMREIDRTVIITTIGEGLANEIKTQIKENNVSVNNKKLLLLIRPCVASLTIASAFIEFSVKITGNGVQVLSTSPFQTKNVEGTASDNAVKRIMDKKTGDGESARQSLYNYLYKNHASYPLFEADSTVYTTTPTTSINNKDNGIYGLM